MNRAVVFGIILMALASWPVLYILNKFNLLKDVRHMLLSGVVILLATFVGTFLLFRRYYRDVDPFMYVFTLFSVDALGGLGIILELDGYLPKMPGASNVTEVEPYLNTAHGSVLTYWNGTVHFILCISAIALYTRRDSHREVALYFAGSLLNSMAVLLPACFTTKKMASVTMPFQCFNVFIGLAIIFYYSYKSPIQARTFLKYSPIWKRPVECIFFGLFLMGIVVASFRGLAVLGGNAGCMKDYLKAYEPYLTDPSNFPKYQAVTYDYLFIIYYLFAVYGLLCPGQHWMADWSLIHAGAAAQAQVTYITGSVNRKTPVSLRSPASGTPHLVFWTINLALFVVPHLFAWWCQRDAENYGRTYTVDLATPVTGYSYSHPRRSVRLQQKAD